ncbi:hypothetical protein [uncultured Cyclobacterium sp.]|uniref:hypothetical protein n=1 Tax=uncultured Cyclobacterium sp. TaxID=453820 RepID=UPI0030EDC3BE|tara:strand:+ start:78772 stop:79215 length:444 start_codon:yes stop_codon:yes gene_type:complete
MTDTLNKSALQNFEVSLEERYAQVLTNKSEGIIICTLLVDYVPIADFKAIFHQITSIVKKGTYHKFIFDKRALRAFHQPSMEWYFIDWKKEVYHYGIKTHRKILPNEAWFKKMVMIAKKQILEDYPGNIINDLDMKYCDTIEEAIKN